MDATPISGPALVKKTKSDSLAKELVGTLHIPNLELLIMERNIVNKDP